MQSKTHKIISRVIKNINREYEINHETKYKLTLIRNTLYLDVHKLNKWVEIGIYDVNDEFLLKNATNKILRKVIFLNEFEKVSFNEYILLN